MSNRFRKYCLGLSTRGGDQRPLSRGGHWHGLMFAKGGSCVLKSDLSVPVRFRGHVPSCAHAWMCSSGGSGAGGGCECS